MLNSVCSFAWATSDTGATLLATLDVSGQLRCTNIETSTFIEEAISSLVSIDGMQNVLPSSHIMYVAKDLLLCVPDCHSSTIFAYNENFVFSVAVTEDSLKMSKSLKLSVPGHEDCTFRKRVFAIHHVFAVTDAGIVRIRILIV